MRFEVTQSRRHSLLESVCNVTIGYSIAVATQAIVFPWFGIYMSGGQDAEMAAIFTVVSLLRGYAVRRAFNWYGQRQFERDWRAGRV